MPGTPTANHFSPGAADKPSTPTLEWALEPTLTPQEEKQFLLAPSSLSWAGPAGLQPVQAGWQRAPLTTGEIASAPTLPQGSQSWGVALPGR